jgi:hypothetical protein
MLRVIRQLADNQEVLDNLPTVRQGSNSNIDKYTINKAQLCST